MRTVIGYLKVFFSKILLSFGVKIIGTVSELLIPFILSYVLDNVEGMSVYSVSMWGVLMMLCATSSCVFNVKANRMATGVSRDFVENLRRDLFAKTLRLSAAQTDKFTIPSLESRITTDTYNVHGFFTMMLRMGARSPIVLIGGIVITLIMDAYLAMVMLAVLPFIFVTVLIVSKKGVKLYKRVQHSVDNMIRIVREDSIGIRVIKALSKRDYEHRRYEKANRALIRDEINAGMIMGASHPIMNFLMNAGIVGVIALSSGRVEDGLSTPGTVIAFMQYFTLLSMAMMTITRMFVMYTKAAASAQRIEEVLTSEEEISVMSKDVYPDKKQDAHICFDNVTFSYKGRRNNLENINFTVNKGGSLGIIGATGSGKSTIIKLLLRFYDVNEGGIYLVGEDIRTIDKVRLYKKFGSALQQDFLYADTIEENIKFGRELSFDEVVEAAKIAQADDFINEFPDKYEHILSQHGTNISGGQKQRVLISRAIAAKPEILILDDSSSALDYKTDATLRRTLAEKMADTTVITVAQRVSSVKDSDLIIVLDDGKIIGMGKHEELLENCIEYREISDSQMGGAFVE